MNKKTDGILFHPVQYKWILLFYLLGAELILAYSLPENILSQWSILGGLADLMEKIAPVLGKITYETAARPEAVRCYLVLTISLMPVKVWIFYSWLNSDREGIYRYLVVSLLTDQRPAGGDNFITDPLRQEKCQPAQYKPRSLFSRLIWSTLILLLTIGSGWTVLEFGSPDSNTYYLQLQFKKLVSGGYDMWSAWVIKRLTTTSFLLAVSICILRDHGLYFKQLFIRLNGEHHE